MIVDYDAYKDGAPGAAGLDVKRQNLAWVRALSRGCREGAEGGGRLERRSTRRTTRSSSSARRRWPRLGSVPEDQSARRQGCLHQGLDGGAQGGADRGRHGRDLRVSPPGSAGRRSDTPSVALPCRALRAATCGPAGPMGHVVQERPCRQHPTRPAPQPQPEKSNSPIRTRQAGLVEAEVTHVRKLTGFWRWLLVAHDGGHHCAVHQPAVQSALLRRLHAAQHGVLLPPDPVHAALHVPDFPGQRGARRPTGFPGTTWRCSSRRRRSRST